MGIQILDKDVINKISAGEVVEKPASIVKELVENSIDAGATSITIEIEGGGIDLISVTDNGCGINKDEVILAFTPHATSKLSKFEDLNSLNTMGFRGEALATISAVSKVTLITKTENDESGIRCEIVSGEEISRNDIACVTGTKIEVKNVFYNTPARLKFLRKPKSEESDITNYVEKLILSHSDISFKYIVNGKLVYYTNSGTLLDNIYTIYGGETALNMLPVNYEISGYRISGYICKPEYAKANRTYQNLFVNNRFCSNALVSTAVSNAYNDFAMKGKFPMYVLFIDLPQNELDVNVHPNKLEVKFTDTNKIYMLCMDGVFKALSDNNHIKSIDESNEDEVSPKNVSNVREVEQGVSFNELVIDNNIKSTMSGADNENYNSLITPKDKRDNILSKDLLKDLLNNDEDGTIEFDLTNNLIPGGGEKLKKESGNEIKLQEIVLTTTDNIQNETKDNLQQQINKKKMDVLQKIEQHSYENLFKTNYRIVGKIFNTYLILELDDKVYFIDQHAGHERLRYDSLMENIKNNTIQKQNLMFPYTFGVSNEEYNFLYNNMQSLNDFGIEISEFGVNTFKISAVPLLLAEINLKNFVDELLKNVNGLAKSPNEIIKERFMQMACKSAVKGGDDLKEIEIEALLKKLEEAKVLLCPHGRPIVVEVDKKQIEKWFKRIV